MAVRAFIAIGLLCAILLLAWAMNPAPLYRDAPRDLPWQLPDASRAGTHWELTSDGRIHNSVHHFFLRDITPQMVSWFYRQLPIASVVFKGQTYPLYHLFHPTEHGRLSVLQAANDGLPGMGPGAIVDREEWFGPYDSKGKARIAEFSAEGMLAIAEVAGIAIGHIQHTFIAVDGGTDYRVDAVIGSQLPLVGPAINLYLRTQVFHPEMMVQWQRHQIEEVASLQFFLPALYAQRENGSPFLLELETAANRQP